MTSAVPGATGDAPHERRALEARNLDAADGAEHRVADRDAGVGADVDQHLGRVQLRRARTHAAGAGPVAVEVAERLRTRVAEQREQLARVLLVEGARGELGPQLAFSSASWSRSSRASLTSPTHEVKSRRAATRAAARPRRGTRRPPPRAAAGAAGRSRPRGSTSSGDQATPQAALQAHRGGTIVVGSRHAGRTGGGQRNPAPEPSQSTARPPGKSRCGPPEGWVGRATNHDRERRASGARSWRPWRSLLRRSLESHPSSVYDRLRQHITAVLLRSRRPGTHLCSPAWTSPSSPSARPPTRSPAARSQSTCASPTSGTPAASRAACTSRSASWAAGSTSCRRTPRW